MDEQRAAKILVHLQRIDNNLDRMLDDMDNVSAGVTSLTSSVNAIERDHGVYVDMIAHLQAQVDRLRDEIARINRRLDCSETAN